MARDLLQRWLAAALLGLLSCSSSLPEVGVQSTSVPRPSRQPASWCEAVEGALEQTAQGFRCLPIPNFLVTGFYGTEQNPERSDFASGCFAGEQDAADRLRMSVRPVGQLGFAFDATRAADNEGELDLGFLGAWAPSLRLGQASSDTLKIRVELADAELRVLSSVPEILGQQYMNTETRADVHRALEDCLTALCAETGEQPLVYTAKVLAAVPVITLEATSIRDTHGNLSLLRGLADFEITRQARQHFSFQLRAKNKLNVAALVEPARAAFERSRACAKLEAQKTRRELSTGLRTLGLQLLSARDLERAAAEAARLRELARSSKELFSEDDQRQLLAAIEGIQAAAPELAAPKPTRGACNARSLLAEVLTSTSSSDFRELVTDVAEPLLRRLTNLANTSGLPCADPAWFLDQDGDGYGDPQRMIRAPKPPQGHVANALDCFDRSRQAHPGQTTYFPGQRGDGSFDYDCDGKESKQRELLARGCQSITRFGIPIRCWADVGWQERVPACGREGRWLASCEAGMLSCDDPLEERRVQACR